MNEHEGIRFLFTIVKEIQHSFTSPVIFFTQKDYAENIFNTFKNIHNALLKQEPPEKIAEIVSSFHTEWLNAVQEVEMFSKGIKDTPHAVIDTALKYTMDCTQLIYNHTLEYVNELESTMTEEENQLLHIDLTILNEMKDTVISALEEKKQYFRKETDQTKYLAKITDEIKELLHWLDRLNDRLATEFCNVLQFKILLVPRNLREVLKLITNEVARSTTSEAQLVTQLLKDKTRAMTSKERMDAVKELQISKVTEKIRALEARMSRLRVDESPALMALEHKAIFLEERLNSLENISKSVQMLLKDFKEQDSDEDFNEYKHTHIFSHLLPHPYRCRLVGQLIEVWNNALTEKVQEHESIIDILSVVNLKEAYSDEMGNFTVDKYGRKIYTMGDDDILYQLNEHNNLVPLNDDEKHIYFYDDCGRYYTDDRRERVYKNHDVASEYVLNKAGRLVKVFEVRDGVEYFYDNLGRYYVNKDGLQVYRDEGSSEEYVSDSLGCLIKIRDKPLNYAPCPVEPITMEENKYLKREVGEALKKCIAEVVVHQPLDPLAYLADLLIKYSDNVKAHQKYLKDEQERFEQSQLAMIPTTKEDSISTYEYEDTEDLNLINYQHATGLNSSRALMNMEPLKI